MSNTLTGLLKVMYTAAQNVNSEACGMIRAVKTNLADQGVAKDQTLRIPVSPTQTATDFTPAATSSSGTDRTMSYVDVTISKSRKSSFNLTNEEERALSIGGNISAEESLRQSLEQAMRTLRNEVETDLCGLYNNASRAYGSAGTSPFATSHKPLAQMLKILIDNGTPSSDLSCVIDTTAGADLRGLSNLYKVNESGDASLLRNGMLGRLSGFNIYESAEVSTHTAGTGVGYVINGADAIAATSVAVKTGAGTVLAGDAIGIQNGGGHKYVVKTGIAAAGSLVLNTPGLRVATTDGAQVTIEGAYTPNMCFDRNSIVLVARPPIIQPNAITETSLVSDQSGLTFLVVRNLQYGQISWEVHLAWGVKTVQPENVAILIG